MDAAAMLVDGHTGWPRFTTRARSNPALPELFQAAELKLPTDVQKVFEE